MLCGSLDGRGVWGRKDMCVGRAEFLSCSPETITLFVNQLNKRKSLIKKLILT